MLISAAGAVTFTTLRESSTLWPSAWRSRYTAGIHMLQWVHQDTDAGKVTSGVNL